MTSAAGEVMPNPEPTGRWSGAISILARVDSFERSSLPQVLLQHLRGLVQGIAHGRHLADRVEQPVVVDEVFVASDGDVYPGGIEFARIGQPFFA